MTQTSNGIEDKNAKVEPVDHAIAIASVIVGGYVRSYVVGRAVKRLLNLGHEVLGTPKVELSRKQTFLLGRCLRAVSVAGRPIYASPPVKTAQDVANDRAKAAEAARLAQLGKQVDGAFKR